MPRKILALALALAAATTAAAAPKPASKPAAAAAPKAAGPSVRDPAGMVSLLAAMGATAQIARREGDAVFLTVTSPTEIFSAQFAGCDAQGRNCQAVLFDRQGVAGQPTLAQINAFNQTSVLCRLYQDKDGKAHVEYSALLFSRDGRAEMLTHLNGWRGCLGDFDAFLRDPAGYLAGAA
jgi:hypothetical protein